MGLIGKIFGGTKDKEASTQAPSEFAQFHESESTNEDDEGRNAAKRELLHVTLRDTMRKHGIPSDWIESRILTTTTRTRRIGLHVQFIVRQGHDRLLSYVFAFQESFMREVTRFDPRAGDWLLSVSWRFEGDLHPQKAVMPDPKTWAGSSGPAAGAVVAAGAVAVAALSARAEPDDELPIPRTGFEPTQDPTADEDDDVSRDLKALFAIRDAVIADTRPPADDARSASEGHDFEATRPGFDEDHP